MSDKYYQNLTLIQKEGNDVEVRLKDQCLRWDVAVFAKTAYRGAPFPLFTEINSYLAILPMKTQESLFMAYRKIHESLMRSMSAAERIRELRPLITQFSNLIDIEALINWTRVSANIVIPPSLASEYVDHRKGSNQVIKNFDEDFEEDEDEESGNVAPKRARPSAQAGTRDKTYLRDDYIQLVALTLGFRLLVPVWGEFLARTENETGTSFKEYYAGKLLEGSAFESSAPYEKLRLYIEGTIKAEKENVAAVLDSVSSEDYPTWALYMTIIRRVTIGDVQGATGENTNPNNHLISFIYRYVIDRIVRHENNFAISRIRDKRTTNTRNADEESKLTVFENVKISERFSPGDEEEISVFASDTKAIVKEICPDLPKELLDQALEAINVMQNQRIHKPQERLVSWIIGPYLPPSSIMIMEKVNVLHIMAISQAVLWYRGFKDLAIIMTLTELPRSGAMMVGSSMSRSHIPRAMSEELNKLYPHVRRPGRSLDVSKRDSVVHEIIRETVSNLFERDWKINIHKDWLSSVKEEINVSRRGQYYIPSDIRAHIARLAIRIARNKYPFHNDAFIDEIG